MKAVVKTERAYGHVEIMDANKPHPKAGEVLVKIKAVGVCGSDVHIYQYDDTYHHIPVPLILGHEYAGIIEEVGPGVTDWKVGERVMGEAVIPCDSCMYCRTGLWEVCQNRRGLGVTSQGAMMEYMAVPLNVLHRLPDGLDFHDAVLAQPCAVAMHGIERTSFGKGDQDVAVFGPGIIGLSAALALKAGGASSVVLFGTDVDEEMRLSAARKMGLEAVNLSKETPLEALKRVTGKSDGFDFVYDCSGAHQAITDGISVLKKGGTLMEIGIPTRPITIDLAGMVRSEKNLMTSYSANWQSYERAIKLIYDNRVELGKLVNKYRLDDQLIQAFEDSVAKKTLKAVVLFD